MARAHRLSGPPDPVTGWMQTLLPHPRTPPSADGDCLTLAWAESGGMALTGRLDGPPILSPAAGYGLAGEVLRALACVTGRIGERVVADPAEILFGRAGLAGYRRAGRRSAGGASRLLRTADGWCAVTLSRPDDFASVPAILSSPGDDDPWTDLESAAPLWRAEELAQRAQLLGVPAAAVPPRRRAHHLAEPRAPWRLTRIAPPAPKTSLAGRLVVDLSALWAGPLCGRLLGVAGARVLKVESVHRPDGARSGHPRFFEWLHDGQAFRPLDFRSESGRKELAELIDAADIVIEASRPRALAQLGVAPEDRPHRAGQVWLSISGYGRARPLGVAFGDDAAAAGGLLGWDEAQPVFCGDAIADPLSGICAALAVACAVGGGGGIQIDLSMRAVAAAFAAAWAPWHGPHHVHRDGRDWAVECVATRRTCAVAQPRPPENVALSR
ncbi:CoA transferase [Nocardia farcinica]|uniref:CoA transferase n=1 Tax=Nocardia farcinica TaxID=37329 RepID=UPI00379E370D